MSHACIWSQLVHYQPRTPSLIDVPSIMSTRSKSKQEEALQFLDDLDSLSPDVPASGSASTAAPNPANPGEAAEVLAFLDEITQKSSEPVRTTTSYIDRPLSRAGTPTLRKSAERVKVGAPSSLAASSSSSIRGASPAISSVNVEVPAAQQEPQRSTQSGGWGWGNVWTSASAALQQAKTVVDEQVKHLPKQDQARKWSEGMLEYAKNAQLDKLSTSCTLLLDGALRS